LSFDCYGTLIDWETGLFTALAPLRSAAGLQAPRDQVLAEFARHEVAQQAETPAMLYPELLAQVHRRLARDWGVYLAGRVTPRPGARRRGGPDLAVLQEALAEAGFEPRFRRRSTKTVEIALRHCPFKDLLEEHGELVCGVHRGLVEGILGASRPSLSLTGFEPSADLGAPCRLTARGS
jgi:hypothetical protein